MEVRRREERRWGWKGTEISGDVGTEGGELGDGGRTEQIGANKCRTEQIGVEERQNRAKLDMKLRQNRNEVGHWTLRDSRIERNRGMHGIPERIGREKQQIRAEPMLCESSGPLIPSVRNRAVQVRSSGQAMPFVMSWIVRVMSSAVLSAVTSDGRKLSARICVTSARP